MRSWLTCSQFRSAQPIRLVSGMFLLLLLILLLLPRLFLWSQLFPSLHPLEWIREKLLWKEKFQSSLSLWPSFLLEENLPHSITVASSGTSDLSAHIGKLRGRQIGRLLELPCITNVELVVMSGIRVLRLKKSHPGIKDLIPKILFQGISSSTKSVLQQKGLGSPKKPDVEKQKTAERELFYEGTPFVSSFMRDLVRYLDL
jgi:hypothetical protein